MRNVIAIASILAGFSASGETLQQRVCKNHYWELEGMAKILRIVYTEKTASYQSCKAVKAINDFIAAEIKRYNKTDKCDFKRYWFTGEK